MNNFSGFAALLKKELMIYFAGPIFYITGFFFLILSGYFFYANTIYYGIASLTAAQQAADPQVAAQLNPQAMVYQPLFMVLAIILMFLVPLLTMRLLAEEKRSGTAELLFTYPLADWTIILGKFAAAFLIYLIFLAFTASYSLAFCFMTRVDLGAVAAGYLGAALLGASFLALGLFASSLTENQIIAGVVGFALLLILWVIGWSQELGAGGALGRVMQFLSLMDHYDNFCKGVIDTRDLVYHASFIFFFLFLTKRQLESRRWRA